MFLRNFNLYVFILFYTSNMHIYIINILDNIISTYTYINMVIK